LFICSPSYLCNDEHNGFIYKIEEVITTELFTHDVCDEYGDLECKAGIHKFVNKKYYVFGYKEPLTKRQLDSMSSKWSKASYKKYLKYKNNE